MRSTLNDQKLEAQFQKEGYVKVPFLSQEEVEVLKAYYFETLEDRGGSIMPSDEKYSTDTDISYDFTFIDKDSSYKKAVFKKITEAFQVRVDEYLNSYKGIIANFIFKKESGGEVPLHQNWAFVDEKICSSVSIWCPLIDSNKANGTLEVVPGSHKRFGEVRGPMIRSELEDIKEEIIDQTMVPIEAKAGEAVILDDSIVHYSSPNDTDGLRLTIQLILIPSELESIHYHMDLSKDRSKVEVLEVDHEFYMNFNPWKKPSEEIKRINEFKFTPGSITIQEFKERLYGPRFDESQSKNPVSFFNKIKSTFLKQND